MTMTDERLAELDAVMAKATLGHWHVFQCVQLEGDTLFQLEARVEPDTLQCVSTDIAGEDDAVAIVALHNAYPDLRAHIDAQDATIARQAEALNIAHTAFADCDQSNPMLVEAVVIIRAALTGAARKPDANPFVGTNWQVRADTPTPATDAREAVAQALYDHESPNSALAWEHKPAHFQENVRRFADAAILALTPFIAASIRTPPTPAAEEREAVAQWCSGCHEVRSVDCYRAGCPKSDTERRAAEILAAEANERARWADWARVRSALNHRWAAEGEHLRTERIALSSAYAELADAIERNEHGAGK